MNFHTFFMGLHFFCQFFAKDLAFVNAATQAQYVPMRSVELLLYLVALLRTKQYAELGLQAVSREVELPFDPRFHASTASTLGRFVLATAPKCFYSCYNI